MRIFIGLLLAGAVMCGVASPAAAKEVCVDFYFYYDANYGCSRTCSTLMVDPGFVFSQWDIGVPTSIIKPVPPATVMPPKPTSLNSCSAVAIGNTPDPNMSKCVAKICGPVSALLNDTVIPLRHQSTGAATSVGSSPCGGPRDPCPQKSIPALGPGLLEGDSGSTQQGPAAAGTPTVIAPPSTAGRGAIR
jgi:hypothetical protein